MNRLKNMEVLQVDHQDFKSIFDGSYTKTTQFMTQAIGIDIRHNLLSKYFVNAYLSDSEHKHNYTTPIFLLFSITDYKDENWKKIYLTLIKSPNFLTEYDVGVKDNNFLIMLVFNVIDKYKEDYLNFRKSKYSLFSDEYKSKFPKTIGNKENILYQIITKDETLKIKMGKWLNHQLEDEDEIWDKVRPEREVYRYKKLK